MVVVSALSCALAGIAEAPKVNAVRAPRVRAITVESFIVLPLFFLQQQHLFRHKDFFSLSAQLSHVERQNP